MILSFTAFDKQAEFRKFSCQITELEGALDLLSTITAQGDTIIEAHVIDEGTRTELPPEAFDGHPFFESLQELEVEWQTVLNEPVCSALLSNNYQVEVTRQRLKLYEDRIAQLTRIIDKFEQFRRRTTDAPTHDEPGKDKLIRHYDTMLNTYRKYMDRARVGQQVAQKKLSQLQG